MNIPATGATSRMPRTMNFPVSNPKPPANAATTGTAISATSGDIEIDDRRWRRRTFSRSLRCESCGRLFPDPEPQLFDFNGFLRVGVGDPRQAQLSVRIEF